MGCIIYEKHGEKGLIPKPKGVSADPELRIKVCESWSSSTCPLIRLLLACACW